MYYWNKLLQGTLSGLRRLSATESSLKTVRNAFYYTWKALFVLKIIKFLSWLFGRIEKWLDSKDNVNFKFYGFTTLKQIIAIQILPNILRINGNQTMQFGQLVEHNMRNISLESHTQNVVEKLFPDPFLIYQNWAYLWISSLNFYRVSFYSMPSWGLSKYIETKLQILPQIPQSFCLKKIF